jgi:FMN phosphatase YigB (HAD superfamily)
VPIRAVWFDATSDDWGVEKPDPAFFHKLVAVSGHQPDEIAYVGDRLDNDVLLAMQVGLRAIRVSRGLGVH